MRGLHLQATHLVLQQQGQQAAILVWADALVRLAAGLAGVVDDLQPVVVRWRHQLVEGAGRLLQRDQKGFEQALRHGARGVQPQQDVGLQLGLRRGPLVGALQPPPLRGVWAGWHGGQLFAKVDLFAQVGLQAGDFAAHAGVAAKVARLRHGDLLLGGRGQGEEPARRGLQAGDLVRGDAVAFEVEKADFTGNARQAAVGRGVLFAIAQLFQVDDGQGVQGGRGAQGAGKGAHKDS